MSEFANVRIFNSKPRQTRKAKELLEAYSNVLKNIGINVK
jgi:hypothetical protein